MARVLGVGAGVKDWEEGVVVGLGDHRGVVGLRLRRTAGKKEWWWGRETWM